MAISVGGIIKEVKIKIDEIGLNDAEFATEQDNSDMDKIIKSHIKDAVRFVLSNADWSFMEPDTVVKDDSPTEMGNVVIGEDLVGRYVLPDNFLRLCYAKMNSWKKYVTEPVYWSDADYDMLTDEFVGGTHERPMVGIGFYMAEGETMPKKRIELYKAVSNKDKCELGIVTEPDEDYEAEGTEDTTLISVPEKLESSLILHVAGLTLMTYNEQRADDFFNQALLNMGLNAQRPTK